MLENLDHLIVEFVQAQVCDVMGCEGGDETKTEKFVTFLIQLHMNCAKSFVSKTNKKII